MEQLSSQSEQFARDMKMSEAGPLGSASGAGPFVGLPPYNANATPPFADNAAGWYAAGGPMRGPHVSQAPTGVHRLPMANPIHM